VTLGDALGIAVAALTANKLRTLLTMLGVIIGVSAVIALVAVGNGAQAQITARISGLGTNVLFVRPGAQTTGTVRSANGSAQTLTLDDAAAIAQLGGISGVAPETTSAAQLSFEGQNTNTRVVGTSTDYQDVRNFHAAEGAFISDDDVSSSADVAVLGATTAQNLFGTIDPVGQTIRISRGQVAIPFQVVGVMEVKGATSLGNQDDQVFIPITTMVHKVQVARTSSGSYVVGQIDVEVADKNQINAEVQNIGDLLRTLHQVATDDFTIQSQADTLQTLTASTQTFTVLLGSIAAISLVVGGIGIMNIMLVSVTERTREIGIRKALGARRQDILLQFLVEAVTVSALGGLLGVVAGVGAAHLVNGHTLGTETMYTAVSASSVLLAAIVAAAIGVFFGLYPAMRAARLNPIQALRYE
jgi:putative ABC transport system permease protein